MLVIIVFFCFTAALISSYQTLKIKMIKKVVVSIKKLLVKIKYLTQYDAQIKIDRGSLLRN